MATEPPSDQTTTNTNTKQPNLLNNSLQLDGSFQDDNILLNNALEWFDGYTTSTTTTTGTTNTQHFANLDYDVANIDMDNFQINNMRMIEFDEEPSQRHGETIASMTGSILDQMSSGSTSNSTMDLSAIQSLTLFSPMEQQPTTIQQQFSTDSLDVSGILATCMTNRNNYTIAFEQSMSTSKTPSTDSSRKIYDCSTSRSGSTRCRHTPSLRSIEIQTSCESDDLRSTNEMFYGKYNLPDLAFLRRPTVPALRKRRPLSCNDIEELKQKDFSHIKDWPSLNFLLPAEYQKVLGEKEDRSEKEMSFKGSRTLRAQQQKSKRLSLPVTIPEVGSLTEEIERNLSKFEEWNSCQNDRDPYERTSTGQSGDPYVSDRSRDPSEGSEYQSNRQSYESSRGSSRTSYEGSSRIAHVTPMQGSRVSRVMVDLVEKQAMTDEVNSSIDRIIRSSSKPVILSQSTAGKLVLEGLCPALYNLLSDGLSPCLETIFGKVPNTVWRVVEASIQCGPTAQTLNELVMKINSEDSLAEGPIKFNAFICGLLNLSALQSWLTFLRTKERLLRTHYSSESFMFLCNTSTRLYFDSMVTKSNFKTNFQLDIFHQARMLHQAMTTRPKTSSTPIKKQTKSSKYHANLVVKKTTQMKRSFSDERPKIPQKSNPIPKSKTAQNIAKKMEQEKGMQERVENNFKQLQLQWELLASDERVKKFQSKIPRPITSPVKGAAKRF